MTNRYRLEVTEAQLRTIELACEVCARIKIGQPGMALAMLGIHDGDGQSVLHYDLERLIDATLKPAMGLEMNASFGVGKFTAADNLFDLHAAIRYRLAWDRALAEGVVLPGQKRKWPEMMGACYDSPMGWGDQPLPVVAKIEEDV